MILNSSPLNKKPLNATMTPLTLTQGDVAFNGYSLHDLSSKIVTSLDNDDLLGIELNTFNYAKNDGGGVNSRYYRSRIINLSITLKASTAQALNSLLDEFKKKTSGIEGFLDVKVNGSFRRIKATCTSIDFDRKFYNITFIEIKVKFQAMEPFWYEVQNQSNSFFGKTGNFSEEMSHNGTAVSNPTFYLVFSGSSAVTQVVISKDGLNFTINGNFVPGDILIIDAKAKSVTENSLDIDYTGSFPVFNPGSNPFSFSFTGTVNVDISVVVPQTYL